MTVAERERLLIAASVDKDVVDQIDEIAKSRGTVRKIIVREALAEFVRPKPIHPDDMTPFDHFAAGIGLCDECKRMFRHTFEQQGRNYVTVLRNYLWNEWVLNWPHGESCPHPR